MKRWERYNELLESNHSLEEQALDMIIETVLEDAESGITESSRSTYYEKFKGMKEWLNEEVE